MTILQNDPLLRELLEILQGEGCLRLWLDPDLEKDGGFLPPSGFADNDKGRGQTALTLQVKHPPHLPFPDSQGSRERCWTSRNLISQEGTRYAGKMEASRTWPCIDSGAERLKTNPGL